MRAIRWRWVALSIIGGASAIYALTAEITAPHVTIDVLPRVLFAGASLRVMCRVTKDPENRWLDLGVPDLRLSGRQLDGDDAPMTHELLVEHVPCGVSRAVCRLRGASEWLVSQTFEVAGCQ